MSEQAPNAETVATPEGGSAPERRRKNGGDRTSNAIMQLRVEEILRILVDGATYADCIQYAKEAKWSVGPRAVGRYIKRANDLLAIRLERNRDRLMAMHRAKREALYARAVQVADFRTALAAIDSEAKMLGLFPEKSRDAARPAVALGGSFDSYHDDPIGFARNVLKVKLTPDQSKIISALPGRVKVRAGHSVGKTFLAAVAVVWWYYTRSPSVVITTAPTLRDVNDLLWAEIRMLVRKAGLPDHLAPAAPEMRDPECAEEHWAKGYTARKGESFQGRHRPKMLFIFDEDEGVEPPYWKTANTMYQPDAGHGHLCIGNPTTTTSQSFAEESLANLDGSPKWKLFTLSCLNHPNIAAGLTGAPLPVPDAVTIEQVSGWVSEWCEAVPAGENNENDIEWPPESGQWYRPGPEFESRVLGRRPSASLHAVWSEALWDTAATRELSPTTLDKPELGVDVAREGDDWSVVHGRIGPASVLHRVGQGWDTMRTCGVVVETATELADQWNRDHPHSIPLKWTDLSIKVDDAGVGGGVVDRLAELGANVVGINAATVPNRPDRYVLKRDELWFDLVERARSGTLSLSRIPQRDLVRLRQQALAVMRTLDSRGRRVVESKRDAKKRLNRSPDDMDAMNLAYCEPASYGVDVYTSEENR